jgi:DNA-binding NarL/FixJ family response regulator
VPIEVRMNMSAAAREPLGRTFPDPIRILLADDDDEVRAALGDYLESEGFQVIASVSDGLQAFEQAAWLRPDLVLMDLHMPNMDGIAATSIIKAHAPKVPVVVLTAFAERDNRWASQLAGAASFLDKSTPMPELVEALRAAVRAAS